MRGLIRVSLVACLAVFGVGCASGAPSPSSTMLVDFESIFPSAGEVGEVLGLEVEPMGIRGDMGQYWEGTDFGPGALVSTQLQHYRWPVGGAAEDSDDALAGASVEIIRFRSADDAARYGGDIASGITGPLAEFPTELLADLVATGTWTSDEGYGGSTIVARTGSIVIIVTAGKTGATEMETAAEAVTGLVLDRLSGERPSGPWLAAQAAEAARGGYLMDPSRSGLVGRPAWTSTAVTLPRTSATSVMAPSATLLGPPGGSSYVAGGREGRHKGRVNRTR